MFQDSLKEYSCLIFLCTTDSIITGLGIRKYFDFVLASVNAKCAKPDPRYMYVATYIIVCTVNYLGFLRWHYKKCLTSKLQSPFTLEMIMYVYTPTNYRLLL